MDYRLSPVCTTYRTPIVKVQLDSHHNVIYFFILCQNCQCFCYEGWCM